MGGHAPVPVGLGEAEIADGIGQMAEKQLEDLALQRRIAEGVAGEVGAVSYTHLDVYKRQTQASRHELVDIDGDADLDTFIGYSHDPEERKVAWHEQGASPQATWSHHLIDNLTRGYAESLDAGDFDGDGDPDLIIGEYNMQSAQEQPASLWIFENLGQGNSCLLYTSRCV